MKGVFVEADLGLSQDKGRMESTKRHRSHASEEQQNEAGTRILGKAALVESLFSEVQPTTVRAVQRGKAVWTEGNGWASGRLGWQKEVGEEPGPRQKGVRGKVWCDSSLALPEEGNNWPCFWGLLHTRQKDLQMSS